jgi:polyisoprenoid-binding protein YceI
MAAAAVLALMMAWTQDAHATRYAFDDASGSINFGLVASLHDIAGTAQNFSGELDIGSDKPTGKITVQAAGLTTDLTVRDDRMHSYCLEVERFPTVEFLIAATTGDVRGLNSRRGSGTVELRGQLTVRSSTRDVIIPVRYQWRSGTLQLTGSHQVDWSQYGVPDASIIISTLYPEVNIQFDVALTERP